MVSKLELQNIINKYHLNGGVEAVTWLIKDNKLNINFTSNTKEMIGSIEATEFKVEDSTIGISNTSQLLKLTGITNGDLKLDFIKNRQIPIKLIISDNQFTLNYALADILNIPKSGKFNGEEIYDFESDLDQDSVNSIIKAKSALADSETVVFKPYKDFDGTFQLECIFGGDIEYANKVSFYLTNFTKQSTNQDFELHFNSTLIKEILYCNKDFDKGKIFINLEGLIKLEFETKTIKSIYYLVQKQR